LLLLNSPPFDALFVTLVTTNTVFKWMAPVQPKMAGVVICRPRWQCAWTGTQTVVKV